MSPDMWWEFALLCVTLANVYPALLTNHPCKITTPENGTADILCHYPYSTSSSSQGLRHSCTSISAYWQRVEGSHVTNLTDGAKHGLWVDVPGWKMVGTRRVSLLRVRGVDMEDVGVYRCKVLCVSDAGRWEHIQQTELCMEHSPGYSVCALQVPDNKCSWSFGNSVCDRECASEDNLYDGFDCSPSLGECAGTDSRNCLRDFSDGVCDPECQSDACAWDGGDCIDKPLAFASGVVVLNIAPWYGRSGKVINVKALAWKFSKLLRTVVRVEPGDWTVGRSRGHDAWHRPDSRTYESVRRVHVRIDNTECYRECFHTADTAAKFIYLALENKWDPGIPITSIGVLDATRHRCQWENDTFVLEDNSISSTKTSPESKTNSDTPSRNVSESSLSPMWVMVTCGAGFVIIITLTMFITIVIHRIRKLDRKERQRANGHVERLQDRSLLQGTNL